MIVKTNKARIAALTAGPTANIASTSDNNVSSASLLTMQQDNNHSLVLDAMKPSMADATLDSTNLFTSFMNYDDDNSFFSMDDVIMVQQTITEAETVLQQLNTQLKYTTSLKLALRACNNIAEDIYQQHNDLIRHSGELSAAADRLQEEEQILSKHAEEIGIPLQHYDTVDRIGISVGVLFKGKATVRGLAKIKVDSDEFPSVLNDIDNAIIYFGKECGGKEALQAELKRRNSNKKND